MSFFRTSFGTPRATDPPCGSPVARFTQAQGTVVVVAVALFVLLEVHVAASGWRMMALALIGFLLGAVLYGTAFGFTSGYRDFILRRDATAVRAQIVMLALATVLFAPVLASGSALGRSVGGAIAPVGLPVAIGAFVFGIGMQLAGGCGSGTLYTAGSGHLRMLIVLVAFCAGSFRASLDMEWWQRLPAWNAPALGEMYGWYSAAALQLAVLWMLWMLSDRLLPAAAGRNGAGSSDKFRLLIFGAVALAVLNFLTLIVAGHPWSITWAFTLWGAKAASALGWEPTETFWSGGFPSAALSESILHDVTSVMDIGIVLGALATAALAGKFVLRLEISSRTFAAAAIGGLAMGYGSRIAYGCNIGAFFSGVASTSLHGWLWIAAALAGCTIGVRLRPWFGLRN